MRRHRSKHVKSRRRRTLEVYVIDIISIFLLAMICNANAMLDNLFYGVSFVDFQTFISGRMWNVINPDRRERKRDSLHW